MTGKKQDGSEPIGETQRFGAIVLQLSIGDVPASAQGRR
jgi:hypothetical protein